ncbi:MAG: type II/IV secretion system ATPase subunit [Archaeoglobaceae archaeon]
MFNLKKKLNNKSPKDEEENRRETSAEKQVPFEDDERTEDFIEKETDISENLIGLKKPKKDLVQETKKEEHIDTEETDGEEAEDDVEKAVETIEKTKKLDKLFKGKGSKNRLAGDEPLFEPYDPEFHGPLIEYSPPEDWEIVQQYWLHEPYNKIYVIYNDTENEHKYIVVEPELTDYEKEVVETLKECLKDILEGREVKEDTIKEEILKDSIDYLIRDIGIPLETKSYYKIIYYINRDYLNLERITPLMNDKMLEDISCNGYDLPIFVYHREFSNIETNVVFDEPEKLDSFVISLAQKCGKHVSIAEPMMDATMPDGSRIQMTLGKEVTDHGSTFTIRKFKEDPVTPVDLVSWGTFSPEVMAYMWLCIENKKSLIFAGGTASGKTTSTNAIALFIPQKSKIVTIEDTRELTLPHENWIPGVTRDAFMGEEGAIDMYDLLKAALRQRPEYIVVGEVRGKEALTLFQAMSTGHTTYSTLHADTVNGVIHRLENPPINVPRPMIEALDIISIQSQTYIGKQRVRRNNEIAEIIGLDPYTKMIRTSSVFKWDSVKDQHLVMGNSKSMEDIRKTRGWSSAQLEEELENRRKIIEFMVEQNLNDSNSVSNIVHAYQVNPKKILKKMNIPTGD